MHSIKRTLNNMIVPGSLHESFINDKLCIWLKQNLETIDDVEQLSELSKTKKIYISGTMNLPLRFTTSSELNDVINKYIDQTFKTYPHLIKVKTFFCHSVNVMDSPGESLSCTIAMMQRNEITYLSLKINLVRERHYLFFHSNVFHCDLRLLIFQLSETKN